MNEKQRYILNKLGEKAKKELTSPEPLQYDLVQYCKYFAELFDNPQKRYG